MSIGRQLALHARSFRFESGYLHYIYILMIESLLFYLFGAVTLLSAIMVISARNPVHSVLFLILSFFNGAGLFIILHAEFLAMILIIVYVGAVAVLFLFVVMMLNVAQQKSEWFISRNSGSHIPVGILVSLVIFFELIIVIGGWKYKPDLLDSSTISIPSELTNTHLLGNVIYTEHILLFQLSGMILLVAMIGAIVLTFRQRSGVKRQSYFKQISRERDEGVDLVEVESKKGVKIND